MNRERQESRIYLLSPETNCHLESPFILLALFAKSLMTTQLLSAIFKYTSRLFTFGVLQKTLSFVFTTVLLCRRPLKHDCIPVKQYIYLIKKRYKTKLQMRRRSTTFLANATGIIVFAFAKAPQTSTNFTRNGNIFT